MAGKVPATWTQDKHMGMDLTPVILCLPRVSLGNCLGKVLLKPL